MRNARERVTYYVQTRPLCPGWVGPRGVKRLPAVQIDHAADLPVVSEQFRPPRTAGQIISNEGRKVVSCVEVTVPVFLLQVGAEQRYLTSVLSHVIQSVRPSVDELRGEPAPGPHFQDALQRVVIRGADAVELLDRTPIRGSPKV